MNTIKGVAPQMKASIGNLSLQAKTRCPMDALHAGDQIFKVISNSELSEQFWKTVTAEALAVAGLTDTLVPRSDVAQQERADIASRLRQEHACCIMKYFHVELCVLAWCAHAAYLDEKRKFETDLLECTLDEVLDDALKEELDERDVCRLAFYSGLMNHIRYDCDESYIDNTDLGKVVMLHCVYDIGAEELAEELARSHVDTNADLCDFANKFVGNFRDGFPGIVRLWADLQSAAMTVVTSHEQVGVANCVFDWDQGTLAILLPSGRRMWLRDVRTAMKGPTGADSPTLEYRNVLGQIEKLDGGRLARIVVAAICRDLRAAALVVLGREGFQVIHKDHDLFAIELPQGEAGELPWRLLAIMATPPAWAAGLRIHVDAKLISHGGSASDLKRMQMQGTRSVLDREY